MSRIESRFEALKEQGKKALIPYITAGDPQKDQTVPLMHALVDAGADIIELGIPFSDPMADGPVIQLAFERSLEHDTSIEDVLSMVKQFREQDNETPIVLMGYLNPIEIMGYEKFAKACVDCGVDGFIVVDLPPEEAEDFSALCRQHELNLVFLLAPTTTEERIKKISDAASGYLYYVSLKGVTGAGNLNVDDVAAKLETIRNITSLPISVGFGIKDADSAAKVAKVADGVVVGSALVNRIADLADTPDKIAGSLSDVISGMRSAMDQ